ncbi:hypothetical protein [Paludisphaera mucosa]|uniref:Uncharacterized protein n=1 Tax=Paludisphaera mucosa TaxID=3030827 RepID=A0ABT6F9R4_9BACT|nr:hypothetical protein [Paludisphaera mucosa]MDG3004174.1 hypothetical protein [Paludisphaera mucosa]
MAWLIGAGVLPVCIFAAWCILHRPLRIFFEDLHVDQARLAFRRRRERLEAEFVASLGRFDRDEGLRWDDAQWHDEVLWARDRQTRRFLALVCVHFEPDPFETPQVRRHATAVFEFHKGRWRAEGKRLDQVRPDEAVGRNRRYEPVAVVHPNPRRVG